MTVVQGHHARVQGGLLRLVGRSTRRWDHRGLQRTAWRLAGRFPADNAATVNVGTGRFRFRLSDGYWAGLLIPGYRYEPEVEQALDRLLDVDGAVFLDGGANLGYWSVFAAGRLTTRGVAVEAAPPTFRQLLANSSLNGHAFDCVNAALWRTDGEPLEIVTHDQRHAGASVVDRRGRSGHDGYTAHIVRSVTIDSLLADRPGPAIVKLDVEGAEIPALDGAARLFDRDAIVIFEDHGHDSSCAVSARLLDDARVALVDLTTGHRLRTTREVAAKKTDPARGYNFAAVTAGSAFAATLGV